MKSNIENKIAILKSMLNQIKYNDPKFRLLLKNTIAETHNEFEQKIPTKEIIRRLRIQNKKLLARIADLTKQLEISKSNERQTALAKAERPHR